MKELEYVSPLVQLDEWCFERQGVRNVLGQFMRSEQRRREEPARFSKRGVS